MMAKIKEKLNNFWDEHSFGLIMCIIFVLVPLLVGVIIYLFVSPITPLERLITIVVIFGIGSIWDFICLGVLVNS